MTYTNIKFAARHKETKQFLYLKYNGPRGNYDWDWVDANPEFDNVTLYCSGHIFEEDLCYLARQEPTFKLSDTEIIQVKINYQIWE